MGLLGISRSWWGRTIPLCDQNTGSPCILMCWSNSYYSRCLGIANCQWCANLTVWQPGIIAQQGIKYIHSYLAYMQPSSSTVIVLKLEGVVLHTVCRTTPSGWASKLSLTVDCYTPAFLLLAILFLVLDTTGLMTMIMKSTEVLN